MPDRARVEFPIFFWGGAYFFKIEFNGSAVGEVCYFLFFWRGVLFIDRPVCSYIMYKDVLLLLSSNNLCFPYFPIRRMGIPLVVEEKIVDLKILNTTQV